MILLQNKSAIELRGPLDRTGRVVSIPPAAGTGGRLPADENNMVKGLHVSGHETLGR